MIKWIIDNIESIELTVLAIVGLISFFSFMMGLGFGSVDDCKYSSIVSRINIPYVIGCELSKPRFNK